MPGQESPVSADRNEMLTVTDFGGPLSRPAGLPHRLDYFRESQGRLDAGGAALRLATLDTDPLTAVA